MVENKYLEDLKNLKPLPLEPGCSSSVGSHQSGGRKPEVSGQKSETGKAAGGKLEMQEINIDDIHHSSFNNQHSKEVSMERLTGSKTLWGFGIAVFIYIVQHILIALNITGPDNLIVKAVIEAVIAIAGFFGVYGVRDALRKMSL